MLGSWDLQVGSFSYLVVYLEREEPTDFERLLPFKISSSIFEECCIVGLRYTMAVQRCLF